MKKISQYICILAAMLLSAPAVAMADNEGDPSQGQAQGIVLNKSVTEKPDPKTGKYYLTLDAYATGNSATTIIPGDLPVDVVLALDFSSSMVTEAFNDYTKLDRPYTYKNTTIEAPDKKNEKPNDWQKPYYYKINDQYYQVTRKNNVTIGGTSTDYYYLYWQDGNKQKNFNNTEITDRNYPKDYTQPTDQIPVGKIYTKVNDEYTELEGTTSLSYDQVGGSTTYYYNIGGDPDAEISYYYVLSIPDDQGKKYLVGNKKDNLNKDTHDPDATIFTGVLYTQGDPQTVYTATATYEKGGPGKNVTVTILSTDKPDVKVTTPMLYTNPNGQTVKEAGTSFSWNDLKSGIYFYNKSDKTTDIKKNDLAEISTNTETTTKYDALDSGLYSYNKIKNDADKGTTYYFKDGENYKAVTAEKLTDDKEPDYRQIMRGMKTVSTGGTNGCALTFTMGGTTYYLTNDDSGNPIYTTTPCGATSEEGVIYTGPLWGQTRLTALQAAMVEFINTIKEKNAQGGDNRVSVVTFDDEAVTQNTLVKVDEENAQTLIDYVWYTIPATGTDHYEALEHAYDELDNARKTGRQSNRVVVLFTDGESYDGTNTDNGKRTVAINALKEANIIKKIATIYTVTLLNDKTYSNYPWIDFFTRYASSWFNPNPETMPATGDITKRTAGSQFDLTQLNQTNMVKGGEKYFIEVASSEALSSMFGQIADESTTTGGSSIENLEEMNCLVAVDILSHFFKLPKGVENTNDITVSIQKCTGPMMKDGKQAKDEIGNLLYEFGDDITVFPHTPSDWFLEEDGTTKYEISQPSLAVSEASKEVDVYNFNFGKYWCGPRETKDASGNVTKTEYDGYRVVFKIPIEIDPENPGGASLTTNDPRSGIYIGQTNADGTIKIDPKTGLPLKKEGKDGKISAFEVPQVDLPNIVIRKEGLQVGESATFLVTNVNGTDEAVRVIITCTEADKGKKYISAKVKLGYTGRYKVQETQWAWGYTPVAKDGDYVGSWTTDESKLASKSVVVNNANTKEYSITRDVNDLTQEVDGTTKIDGKEVDTKGTIFYFVNGKTTNLNEMKYSEAHKRNIFKTPTEYIWRGPTGSGESGEEEVVGGDTDVFE